MKHPTAAFDQSAVGALAQSKFGSDQGVSRGGEEWAGVDALVATHLMRHVAGAICVLDLDDNSHLRLYTCRTQLDQSAVGALAQSKFGSDQAFRGEKCTRAKGGLRSDCCGSASVAEVRIRSQVDEVLRQVSCGHRPGLSGLSVV